MKQILAILILSNISPLGAQIEDSYFKNLDTNKVVLLKSKNDISEKYFRCLAISPQDLADINQEWYEGCIREIGMPDKKCNFIARDSMGTIYMSITTFGGAGTEIYITNFKKHIYLKYCDFFCRNFGDFYKKLIRGKLEKC